MIYHRSSLVIVVAVIGLTLSTSVPAGAESLLFHVKTSLAEDDAQICVAPNVALAALESGDTVTLLFDGSAVTSITKGWGWFTFGDTTPMDKAGMPERERVSLAEQFDIPLSEIPHDYGAYLRFIEERGARVLVNRTMLTLYNIDPSDVIIARAIELKDMLALFKEADHVLVY